MILTFENDGTVVRRLGVKVKVRETLKGHYALLLFEFGMLACHSRLLKTDGNVTELKKILPYILR